MYTPSRYCDKAIIFSVSVATDIRQNAIESDFFDHLLSQVARPETFAKLVTNALKSRDAGVWRFGITTRQVFNGCPKGFFRL